MIKAGDRVLYLLNRVGDKDVGEYDGSVWVNAVVIRTPSKQNKNWSIKPDTYKVLILADPNPVLKLRTKRGKYVD